MEEFGTLYKAGKFGEAFDVLERARVLNPLPILRHDQAVCLAQMGKPELAAQFYRSYLQEAPNAPNADIIQRKINNLQGEAMKLAIGGVRARPGGIQRGPLPKTPQARSSRPGRTSRCRCSCTTPRRRTTRAATTRRPSSTTSVT